ncbi:NAC domain-containing protein 86-like [Fagus crenata]
MSASQSSSVVVPTGYKFRPTDEELVRDYLYNKVNGIPFKWVDLVPEYEGYGTKEPCQIWEEFGGLNSNNGSEESQLCFFTKGSCFKQTIDEEGCCWKSDGSEEWIKDVVDSVTNVRIGVRKTYYYKNDESEDNNNWIMHELSLDDSLVLQQAMFKDYVVCRIKKNLEEDENQLEFTASDEVNLEEDNEEDENQLEVTADDEVNLEEDENQLEVTANDEVNLFIGPKVTQSGGISTMERDLQVKTTERLDDYALGRN